MSGTINFEAGSGVTFNLDSSIYASESDSYLHINGYDEILMQINGSSIMTITDSYVDFAVGIKIIEDNFTHQIYGDSNGYLHIDGSENVYIENDVHMEDYGLYAKRLGFGSNRYIYLDTNNVLKYYDNGTVRTIQLS